MSVNMIFQIQNDSIETEILNSDASNNQLVDQELRVGDTVECEYAIITCTFNPFISLLSVFFFLIDSFGFYLYPI